MNRRDFIRSSARRAATVAIPAAGAAIAGGAELYDRLSEQLSSTAQSLQSGLRDVSARVGSMAERIDYLELRYRLVLTLLVVSMLIDGGLSWMIFQTPMPIVA